MTFIYVIRIKSHKFMQIILIGIKKNMHSIDINILVGNSLTSLQEGKNFLEGLYKSYPELYPERFGSYEPLRNKADPSDHELILDICNNDIHWKRRRPKVEGSLLTAWGPRPFHGRFAISINSDKIISDNFEQLIIDLSHSFGKRPIFATFNFNPLM